MSALVVFNKAFQRGLRAGPIPEDARERGAFVAEAIEAGLDAAKAEGDYLIQKMTLMRQVTALRNMGSDRVALLSAMAPSELDDAASALGTSGDVLGAEIGRRFLEVTQSPTFNHLMAILQAEGPDALKKAAFLEGINIRLARARGFEVEDKGGHMRTTSRALEALVDRFGTELAGLEGAWRQLV